MAEKEAEQEAAAPKKKKKGLKLVGLAVGLIALIGGGAGAGVYAAQSGMLSAAPHEAAPDVPQLVPKSEEKRASDAGGEGGEGGHGEEAGDSGGSQGIPTPAGHGGDKYASNYYALDKEFTSNLLDSVHFVQIGIAVSTPYDDRVIDNLKTHEIAVRSAILMAIGETSEDQVFTVQGKEQLQLRLKKAINDTLKQKEGFGGIGNVYFTNFVVQ